MHRASARRDQAHSNPLGAASAAEGLAPLADVTARAGLAEMSERLLALRAWLSDDLHALEQGLASLELASQSQAQPATGTERAVAHLLGLPGKRMRPLCVLLAARLGPRGAAQPGVRAVAMACELVHAATLLHDDVVDDSAERRGAPAARLVYGNAASILAGDHLLIHALSLVHQAGSPALLGSLLEVMRRMVQAEAWQLERRGSFEPVRAAYLEVIRGKTAALFAWGLSAGAELGALPQAQVDACARTGLKLGMAFQLVDDLLDLTGDPAVTGKAALHDVREGKLTWPLILASERDPAVLAELRALAAFAGPDAPLDASRSRQLVARIEATGALGDTRAFALGEASDALGELDELPASEARNALRLVVQAAVHRVA